MGKVVSEGGTMAVLQHSASFQRSDFKICVLFRDLHQQVMSYREDRQSCSPDSSPGTSSNRCAHMVL